MSELLIGMQRGVFRLENDGNLQHEEGPATVAFLTRAHEGVMALTQQGALWRRTSSNGWELVHEHPVAEDIWAFGADPRVPGRLYLRVSPALLPCCIGVMTAGHAGQRARPYDAFRATSAGPSHRHRISRMYGQWSRTRKS
jgi:hypothetical protein